MESKGGIAKALDVTIFVLTLHVSMSCVIGNRVR
jgi:hypothetical protein